MICPKADKATKKHSLLLHTHVVKLFISEEIKT